MRDYTNSQVITANIPYIAMLAIGAATIAYAFGWSALALTAAGAYFAYGIVGALWIMAFVCPFCGYYATKGCPCGYGVIAAKMVPKGSHNCFPEKFKRHIIVIVPLWLIPVACGGIAAWSSFSWWLISLIAVFILESWILLPMVSKKHGCAECPQKDSCPWMHKKPAQSPR